MSTVPTEVKFFLCDDIRQEANGKLVVIGLYPGELVILNGAVADLEKKIVGVIQQLCFIFIASDGEGDFHPHLTITAPDGRISFDQPVGQLTIKKDQTGTVAGLMRPFAVHAYGKHHVTLSIDKKRSNFEFEIREGQRPATDASALKTRAKVSRRKASNRGKQPKTI